MSIKYLIFALVLIKPVLLLSMNSERPNRFFTIHPTPFSKEERYELRAILDQKYEQIQMLIINEGTRSSNNSELIAFQNIILGYRLTLSTQLPRVEELSDRG